MLYNSTFNHDLSEWKPLSLVYFLNLNRFLVDRSNFFPFPTLEVSTHSEHSSDTYDGEDKSVHFVPF